MKEAVIGIRTTCGAAIGLGHLRRCLTLAEELKQRSFAVRLWLTGDDHGSALARDAGFNAEAVPSSLDGLGGRIDEVSVVIIDDYAVTADEIARLHRRVRVAVIDDLANRRLDVDLVQNGNADAATLNYQVPAECRLLLGPRYAMLRSSFRSLPAERHFSRDVRRMLVTLGGSDPRGLTSQLTRLSLERLPEAIVDVVLGPLAAPMDLGASSRVVVHRGLTDLLPLMLNADLALSAGGQTNYELAAAGLPALSIRVAENQRGSLLALSQIPSLVAVEADDQLLGERLAELARDADLRQKMSDAGRRLVDGQGAVRVAEAIEALTEEPR